MSAQQKCSALKIPLEIKGGRMVANGKVLQVSWLSWLPALLLGMSLRDKGRGNTQHYSRCRHVPNEGSRGESALAIESRIELGEPLM